MHIGSSGIGVSPRHDGFARIEVTLYSDRSGLSWQYWLDVPAELAPSAAPANALALLMLPIAFHAREDVRVTEPVDPTLLENMKGVQQVWQTWYPAFEPVRILAPPAAVRSQSPPNRTLESFSRGIDSFFSLVRHRHQLRGIKSNPITGGLWNRLRTSRSLPRNAAATQ